MHSCLSRLARLERPESVCSAVMLVRSGPVRNSVTEAGFTLSSMLAHPFKPLHSVVESPLIQDDVDRLGVLIVRRAEYTEEGSAHLEEALRERVGLAMRI